MTDYEVASLLAVGLGTLFVLLILFLLVYLFGAIGLYSMAKRANINNEWLAFIPIGNAYIVGELIDERLKWFTVGSSGGIKLLIICLGAIVLNLIPVIGNIVAILVGIFWIVVYYWLFKKYSESSTLLTIVNVITGGLAGAFIIFALRNKEQRY